MHGKQWEEYWSLDHGIKGESGVFNILPLWKVCDWKEETMSQHFLIIVVLLMKENFVAVNFYSEFYREWFRKKKLGREM